MNDDDVVYLAGLISEKWGRYISPYKYPTTFDKQAILHDYPHYSDDRFKEQQTIFGQEQKGLIYDYNDRLQQWDYELNERAWQYAAETETPHTASFYEKYLSGYRGAKVTLYHIIAGVNYSNGYPYLVFGYTIDEQEK